MNETIPLVDDDVLVVSAFQRSLYPTYLIVMSAQKLRAALEFDRRTGAGKSAVEALAAMRRAESEYHPDVVAALERLKDKLPQRAGPDETSNEYIPLNAQQLIFRPIADQVLRSLRNQSPV